MADIPASLDWGIVKGRIGKIITDSADPERKPDIADLVVTVTLTPSVRWIRVTGEGGGIFYLGDIVCPVVDGVLVDPETNEPGVPVVATIQPDAVPSRVQWTATINAADVVAELDPVLFNVTGGGAVTALEEQFGAEGELPYIVVVSDEDRVRAEEAANRAVVSASTATMRALEAQEAAERAENAEGDHVLGEDGKLLPDVLPEPLTPTGLSAKFASQFDATGRSVAQINAWLSEPSALGVKRLVGNALIDAPLVLKSDTRLDSHGAEVISTHTGNMLRNEHATSTINRDKNIAVLGGRWQRNAGGAAGPAGENGWANGGHSIFLRHVDGVTVQDLHGSSTGGKYFIALGDITDFYVAGIQGEGLSSDTLHVTGPAYNGVIERVRSVGGDDIVAFTTTDYSSYDDVHGPISNVVVRHISGSTHTRVVLVAGSANGVSDGFNLSHIEIDDISQEGAGHGVYTGATATTEAIDDLRIRRVYGGRVYLRHPNHGRITVEECVPRVSEPVVEISPEKAGDLRVDSLAIRDIRYAGTSHVLRAASTAIKIGELSVNGCRSAGGNLVHLGDGAGAGASIERLRLEDVEYRGNGHLVSLTNAAVGAVFVARLVAHFLTTMHVINMAGNCVVGDVSFQDPEVTAVDDQSGILVRRTSANGSLRSVRVRGGKLTGIGRILEVGAATGSMLLDVAGTELVNCNRVAQVAGITLDFRYANIIAGTINQPLRVASGGAATVRGSGWSGYAQSAIVRSTTEVLRVVAQDFPVDLAILARNMGDTARNTNPALGCGLGACLSNGVSWRNLYNGAEYAA